MHATSHGEIFFNAKNAASNLPRVSSWRFEDLRLSTRRLYEAAAVAALEAHSSAVGKVDLGAVAYEAWLEETGLRVNHFMRFDELGETSQMEWRLAAVTVRLKAGLTW